MDRVLAYSAFSPRFDSRDIQMYEVVEASFHENLLI